MRLFHYHYWTNRVEETEHFYVQNGFTVAGRFAKDKNRIKTYHPPLTWNDFRGGNPRFRIIEMRRGKINVTVGAGKKSMFDHIGYLVTNEEHDEVCEQAKSLGWNVNIGDRRTFIGTPFRLRIELQRREDVVEEQTDFITGMDISVKKPEETKDLPKVFGRPVPELHFFNGDDLSLKKVTINNKNNRTITDPNGVSITGLF